MQSNHYVVISVDEKAAFQTESGIFLRTDLGNSFENVHQFGRVVCAPEDVELKEGEKVWFHHTLIDDKLTNKRSVYNWKFKQIPNTTYICPRPSKNKMEGKVGWDWWILATGEWGELKPFQDFIIAKPVTKKKVNEFDVLDKEDENLVEVIASKDYPKGTILLKNTNGDYPLEWNNEKVMFFRPKWDKGWGVQNYVMGVYKDGDIDPVDGVTFVEPIDTDDFEEVGGIWLKKKVKASYGSAKVIKTTHPDLKEGDVVMQDKSDWNEVEVDGKTFHAISNYKIWGIYDN